MGEVVSEVVGEVVSEVASDVGGECRLNAIVGEREWRRLAG